MIASSSPIDVSIVTGSSAGLGLALAPGTIDTDMQSSLRSSDSTRFPGVQLFANLKADGALDSADVAASRVLAWLEREDFGREVIADVRITK